MPALLCFSQWTITSYAGGYRNKASRFTGTTTKKLSLLWHVHSEVQPGSTSTSSTTVINSALIAASTHPLMNHDHLQSPGPCFYFTKLASLQVPVRHSYPSFIFSFDGKSQRVGALGIRPQRLRFSLTVRERPKDAASTPLRRVWRLSSGTFGFALLVVEQLDDIALIPWLYASIRLLFTDLSDRTEVWIEAHQRHWARTPCLAIRTFHSKEPRRRYLMFAKCQFYSKYRLSYISSSNYTRVLALNAWQRFNVHRFIYRMPTFWTRISIDWSGKPRYFYFNIPRLSSNPCRSGAECMSCDVWEDSSNQFSLRFFHQVSPSWWTKYSMSTTHWMRQTDLPLKSMYSSWMAQMLYVVIPF